MSTYSSIESPWLSESLIPKIKDVSGTAFVVAEFRALENDEAYPLYRDPVVRLFLNEDTREAAERVASSFPPIREAVRIRTKYYDDVLEKQLRSGFQQVVLLGSGLDTRAVRKAAGGVTYFEIDDRATLSLKRTCYEEYRIQANVRFLPGNYVTDGFIRLLEEADFDFDLPTYLIWEGNTMYLPRRSVKQTLIQLRTQLRQFRLSFDYMAEEVISKTTGDAGITRLAESFSNMGAPWVSGIRDLQALADEMNLRVIENFKMAELHKAYWPSRRLASPVFNFYSVCTVEGVRGLKTP